MHHIVTTGPPVHARARRLSPEHLNVVRSEFDHMMDLSIIHPSLKSLVISITHDPKEIWRLKNLWRLSVSELNYHS